MAFEIANAQTLQAMCPLQESEDRFTAQGGTTRQITLSEGDTLQLWVRKRVVCLQYGTSQGGHCFTGDHWSEATILDARGKQTAHTWLVHSSHSPSSNLGLCVDTAQREERHWVELAEDENET